MSKLFLSILLFLSIQLHSDDSYWDEKRVKAYVHHSELQRRWAMAFLAPYLKTLTGVEQILDAGCGDGKITADVSKFLTTGSIVGIDLSESMIQWARKQYHPLEYPNLSFQQGSFHEPQLDGSFDLIVSLCALQHSYDQPKALRELNRLLKKNGKLLVLVPALNHLPWNRSRAIVKARSEWAPYWSAFAPPKWYKASEYPELLNQAGFKGLRVEEIKTADPFIDPEELLDWLEGTFRSVVPLEKARKFHNECLEEYLRLDPQAIDEEGVIYVRFGWIAIEAAKAD